MIKEYAEDMCHVIIGLVQMTGFLAKPDSFLSKNLLLYSQLETQQAISNQITRTCAINITQMPTAE